MRITNVYGVLHNHKSSFTRLLMESNTIMFFSIHSIGCSIIRKSPSKKRFSLSPKVALDRHLSYLVEKGASLDTRVGQHNSHIVVSLVDADPSRYEDIVKTLDHLLKIGVHLDPRDDSGFNILGMQLVMIYNCTSGFHIDNRNPRQKGL